MFPEIIRISREVQPSWIILENVAGILSMALESRDSKVGGGEYSRLEDYDLYQALFTRQDQMLLNSICEDIEQEGYAVQPYLIPAVALGAPHQRYRVWFVANSNYQRCERLKGDSVIPRAENETAYRARDAAGFSNSDSNAPNVANSNDPRKRASASGNNGNGAKKSGKRPEPRTQSGRHVGDAPITISKQNNQIRKDRRCEGQSVDGQREASFSDNGQADPEQFSGCFSDVANSRSIGLQVQGQHGRSGDSEKDRNRQERRAFYEDQFQESWLEAATRLCNVDDGVPEGLDGNAKSNDTGYRILETPKGKKLITESKWREESIKAAGNAILPGIAYELFRAIREIDGMP